MILALALSGCYDFHTLDAESGRRLRAVVIELPSGERVFAGWYDEELDTRCSFTSLAGGGLQCVPQARQIFPVFSDSTCSTPVMRAPVDCALPEYVSTFGPLTCGGTEPFLVVYRPGEVIEGARVYERDRGECREVEETVAIRTLAPIDLGELVSATTELRGSGPLLAQRIIGADGSEQHGGLWDRSRDAACGTVGADLGSGTAADRLPCVPLASGNVIDAGLTCDEPLAVWPESACPRPEPELATREVFDGCRVSEVQVFEVGAPASADFGPACDIGIPTQAREVTRADDSVEWLTRELRGSGRVREQVWVNGDVAAGPLFLHDVELDVACRALDTTDGLRCLPFTFHTFDLDEPEMYADAACTEPAAREPFFECQAPWIHGVVPAVGTCPEAGLIIGMVYQRGGELPAAFERDETGACVPSEETAFALEAFPPSSFAELELITE
jgi:hypothetical protein